MNEPHEAEVRGEYRLLMWNDGAAAIGGLYDLGGGQAATPLATFRLDPLQPLPRIAPGGSVRVVGPVRRGSRVRIEAAEDVTIVPTRPLGRAAHTPMLVERDDGTLAHPAAVDATLSRAWRLAVVARPMKR